LIELKKSLGEKTLMKNFSRYKSGASRYHFGSKAHSEMIVYTFLLPGKNDFQYLPARLIRAQRKVLAFLKRSGVQRNGA
jgi:hypothetical protein